MPRAIETRYKGRLFRSRLEARYAVLFDALAIDWDYEPEGYDLGGGTWYLPDFFLRVPAGDPLRQKYPDAGYWVEVKPIPPSDAEIDKMVRLCKQTGHHGYIFVGPPSEGSVYSCDLGSGWRGRTTGGLRGSAPLQMCAKLAGAGYNDAYTRGAGLALSARFDGRGRAST